ncbi:hypothetical protein QO058_22295 [Bosea vestrisii]|nr:hypothetical protein [Bosea vestrisii]WID95468.1 hypothetical protein QO058_22295 [Bosea vestrisii]
MEQVAIDAAEIHRHGLALAKRSDLLLHRADETQIAAEHVDGAEWKHAHGPLATDQDWKSAVDAAVAAGDDRGHSLIGNRGLQAFPQLARLHQFDLASAPGRFEGRLDALREGVGSSLQNRAGARIGDDAEAARWRRRFELG